MSPLGRANVEYRASSSIGSRLLTCRFIYWMRSSAGFSWDTRRTLRRRLAWRGAARLTAEKFIPTPATNRLYGTGDEGATDQMERLSTWGELTIR